MSNPVATAPEPEWAAFAAIDWADRKNFWRLLPAGSRRSEAGELDSTPEAVEVWRPTCNSVLEAGPLP